MTIGSSPLNTYKLKLSSEPWNKEEWNRRASWEWSLRDNNPHLTVWCNNPKEAEKLNVRGKPLAQTPITARMGPFDLFKLYQLGKKIAKTEKPLEIRMDFLGAKYDNKTNERVKGENEIKSQLFMGRNADGIIYWRINDAVEMERDQPEYKFKANYWVTVQPTNGEFSQAQQSSLEFESYLETIVGIFKQMFVSHYVPEPKRDFGKKKQGNQQAKKKDVSPDGFEGFDDFESSFSDDIDYGHDEYRVEGNFLAATSIYEL